MPGPVQTQNNMADPDPKNARSVQQTRDGRWKHTDRWPCQGSTRKQGSNNPCLHTFPFSKESCRPHCEHGSLSDRRIVSQQCCEAPATGFSPGFWGGGWGAGGAGGGVMLVLVYGWMGSESQGLAGQFIVHFIHYHDSLGLRV